MTEVKRNSDGVAIENEHGKAMEYVKAVSKKQGPGKEESA